MLAIVLLFLGLDSLGADPLRLGADDVRINPSRDGGYELLIRARDGIGSVLITESTADPERRQASYALRNPEWHPVNGDEPRKLDGAFLNAQAQGRYFLVSSTVYDSPSMGAAYRIYVPYVVEYGYPWTRSGELYVGDGSWLNIRTFSLPYADYDGGFRDNPFVIRVSQPTPPDPPSTTDPATADGTVAGDATEAVRPLPPEAHLVLAREVFDRIAQTTDGEARRLAAPADIVDAVSSLLGDAGIDLALVIDTTGSMRESIDHVRRDLVPRLLAEHADNDPLRVGVVLFRDYFDEYVVHHLPFVTDLALVQRYVDGARARGGGDIPEAVHEALHTALAQLEWRQKRRMIILIGDAPPHPRPRGSVTAEMVFAEAQRLGVTIHTILLPHP